jgi:phage host-nuclease inhibitor protein Gam
VSTTTKTRIKSKAKDAPQSRDDCARDIGNLGSLQREHQRMTTEMNDAIAEITARYQPELDVLAERAKLLQQGIQTWCEAHRETLTDSGRVKTANLVTGEVSWRQRPPSVAVRGADTVIETLKRLGLGQFVRTKEEVNKEAILNEPKAVAGVAGISVVTGVEDFVVVPFEQEAG